MRWLVRLIVLALAVAAVREMRYRQQKVVAMQQRLNELAKGGTKPLFLEAQFKVIMKNMQGEPVMPTDEGFYSDDDADATPPKIGTAH